MECEEQSTNGLYLENREQFIDIEYYLRLLHKYLTIYRSQTLVTIVLRFIVSLIFINDLPNLSKILTILFQCSVSDELKQQLNMTM